MPEVSQTDLAYAAGIIDGEGYVFLIHAPRKDRANGSNHYGVRVRMLDPEAIGFLHATFGGTLRIAKPSGRAKSPVFEWYLSAKKSVLFLQSLLPYLKVKRHQADLVIMFSKTIRERTVSLGRNKIMSLCPAEITQRQNIILMFKDEREKRKQDALEGMAG